MTESTLTGATTSSFAATEGTELRPGVVRRLLREPTALVSIIFLILVVLAAVLAPLLTPYNPTSSNMADVLAAPFSAAHPRHRRNWQGHPRQPPLRCPHQPARAAIVVVVSLLIGVPAGLVAGYYRGWVDGIGTWISGALMALPAIVVLLVVLARVGAGPAPRPRRVRRTDRPIGVPPDPQFCACREGGAVRGRREGLRAPRRTHHAAPHPSRRDRPDDRAGSDAGERWNRHRSGHRLPRTRNRELGELGPDAQRRRCKHLQRAVDHDLAQRRSGADGHGLHAARQRPA